MPVTQLELTGKYIKLIIFLINMVLITIFVYNNNNININNNNNNINNNYINISCRFTVTPNYVDTQICLTYCLQCTSCLS